MSSSMITTTSWVHRGVSAPFPRRYEIDEAEMERISEMARTQLFEAREGLETAKARLEDGDDEDGDSSDDDVKEKEGTASDAEQMVTDDATAQSGSTDKSTTKKDTATTHTTADDDDLAEYDLEHYDSDPVDSDGETVGMFGNVRSLAYHAPGEKDPYLTLPDGRNESDDEEREEMQILGTDNLLLAGKLEDEVAHLEVYVYEDDADNLYVHHDIMLPAIPLCLEWLDHPIHAYGQQDQSGERPFGNYVAIGTMEPDIEIWDLDVVDSMYPNAILGDPTRQDSAFSAPSSKKKRAKQLKKHINDTHHIDAVLALAANRLHRNLLISGSADTTVKLWDLNTTKCAKSFNTLHTDKVCSLAWHTTSATVLLSGSYDQTVVAADLRAADPAAASVRFKVPSDVETVRWDPHDDNNFYVTTDSGLVLYYDVRGGSASSAKKDKKGSFASPIWTLQAHSDSVSAFDVNRHIPGFIATGSTDRSVKLWRVDPATGGPSMVVSRNMEEVGKVFSVGFAPDEEVTFRLNVAGSRGVVRVWDTSTNGGVRRAFAGRVPSGGEERKKERIVGMAADNDRDSDDDDEEGGAAGAEHHDAGWESMDED